MITLEYKTGHSPNTDAQATEVITWCNNYSQLLQSLGKVGTEVRRWRVLEQDQDIMPHHFIRNAAHEFIFPPQETEKPVDNSRVIDSTPGYSLHREGMNRGYDAALVTGHLLVNYDDADSKIAFTVFDLMGDSVLPSEALAALAILNTPSPAPAS